MKMGRSWLFLSIAFTSLLLITTILLFPLPWFGKAISVENSSTSMESEKTFHLVAVEHKSRINGKEMEVYRFDPGFLVVNRGDKVNLLIRGIHGKVHHISLPAFHAQTTVEKGKVSKLSFVADQPGTYELICHNHQTVDTDGPMIAYLTVLEEKGSGS